jgi:hypothetical protein
VLDFGQLVGNALGIWRFAPLKHCAVAVIGIDNSFHIVDLGSRGEIILRQKWSRGQVEA